MSKVKVIRVKCGKTVLVTISKISSTYICATYFELTDAVVENICDTNFLGGIIFYKHLLLVVSLGVVVILRGIVRCVGVNVYL